jgi:hypothetical protein
MNTSRTIALIVVGALVGGGVGPIAGFVGGVDNPFYIMAVGIAVGAGGSLSWGAAERGR